MKDFELDSAQDRHARAGIPVATTTTSININTSCSISSADIWVYLKALAAGVFTLLYDTDLVRTYGSSSNTFNNNHDDRLLSHRSFRSSCWRHQKVLARLHSTRVRGYMRGGLLSVPVPNSEAFSLVSSPLLLYHGMTHPSFRDSSNNAFPTGISPLLFRVQQPPVSQSRATTSNHGLRVSHLSKRRCDRGQRFGISERSFEHHKVSSSSKVVRVLLGILAREQAGVTTDLAQDPTLVRNISSSFPYVYSFLDSRHTPRLLAQTAVKRSTLFLPSRMVNSHPFFFVGA